MFNSFNMLTLAKQYSDKTLNSIFSRIYVLLLIGYFRIHTNICLRKKDTLRTNYSLDLL